MSVTGNLRTMLPADLLQWLSLSQKTGTLRLRNGRVEKSIFFQKGRILSSASNEPREYLGQFLIGHGFLTEPELMKAMEVQRHSGILLGKILVMIGAIAEEDLIRLMRLKAEETIYDVFLWSAGEFQFEDDRLPEMELIPLQVDITGIIAEGMRRLDDWKRIRELVASDNVIPERMDNLPGTPTDVQKTIAGLIDGRRSIAEIILESRSSAFMVCDTIYRLARQGLVRMREQRVETRDLAVPAQRAGGDDQAEALRLVSEARTALGQGELQTAHRLLAAAQNLDPEHSEVRQAVTSVEAQLIGELHGAGITDARIPSLTSDVGEPGVIVTVEASPDAFPTDGEGLHASNDSSILRRASPAQNTTPSSELTPDEGFLLSRVNGSWDIGALVKISPIRELDALVIFYKLWRDGLIELS